MICIQMYTYKYMNMNLITTCKAVRNNTVREQKNKVNFLM